MAWIPNLDCGSSTQKGADIIAQINNLTALLENAILMTNDISGFDNITGEGLVGTPFEGFQLCNGNNGTPDLRSSFIVCYDERDSDYDNIANVGGEKEHTLLEAEMPAHNHTLTINGYVNNNASPGSGATFGASTGGGLQIVTSNIDTGNAGNNEAHENRPPYYVLAFYKKI